MILLAAFEGMLRWPVCPHSVSLTCPWWGGGRPYRRLLSQPSRLKSPRRPQARPEDWKSFNSHFSAFDLFIQVFSPEGWRIWLVRAPVSTRMLEGCTVQGTWQLAGKAQASWHKPHQTWLAGQCVQKCRGPLHRSWSRAGLATDSILLTFCQKIIVCLEGKSMTPPQGNTFLFCSFQ